MLKTITPADLSAILEAGLPGDAILLDVREPHEPGGTIEGSLNIPMNTFDSAYTQLPKEKHIIVICLLGIRSKKAASFLAARGYDRVSHLKGGMLAWSRYVNRKR
jgi:rhodanese-related sulfurtransferase